MLHDGLYTGDYLVEWLGGLLDQIGVTTFGELRLDDPGSSLGPDRDYALIVHTADLTRGRLVRLPWDYPDYGFDPDAQRVVDAVRASMSIPFFFRPVRHDVRRRPSRACGSRRAPSPGSTAACCRTSRSRCSTARTARPPAGRRSASSCRHARSSSRLPRPEHGALDEALACVRVAMDNADRYYLTPAEVARTIFVDTDHVSATDFHITAEQRQTLYANGQQAASAWVAARR